MERTVILSLSDGERAHLAAMGVTADARGFLHSASGRPVNAGVAAVMLSKDAPPEHAEHGIRPGSFQRPYLREGHQAERAQGLGGVPFVQQGSLPRPDPGPDDVAGTDVDGSGVGPPDEMAKMTPEAFQRHYLVNGHAAESPANTGRRGTTAVPASDPAEPAGFDRGWIRPGHQEPPPDARPANNPLPPGSPGADAYRAAAGVYQANQGQARTEHVMPSGAITATPAACRPVTLPSDMRASAVPVARAVAATKPAPGEMR